LGHSQRGASHVRSELPNQDAFGYLTYSVKHSNGTILAVADGHGNSKSFRSDVGSNLAVEVAIKICSEFLQGTGIYLPSIKKNLGEQQIPGNIYETWKKRVEEHFNKNPFTAEEYETLGERSSSADRDREAIDANPLLAYGSTLLVAFVTDDYLFAFQLGDGDILSVSDITGEAVHLIPKDETLIANETTSLCLDNPIRHFRCRFHFFEERPPAIILLSTDGFSNSFALESGYLEAGVGYLDWLKQESPESLEKNLPAWLEEMTREGSGDDITLGIIYRTQPALSTISKPGLPEGTVRDDVSKQDPPSITGPSLKNDPLNPGLQAQ
jgi:serine/threonine protein phosphatase PrpC